MDEKAVQFVIAFFEDEAGAEETISILKAEKQAEIRGAQAAVAMHKDAQSRIHYKDVGMTPAKGALAGVAIGAIVGIASGGIGLVWGAVGGLLGGMVGKHKRENQVAAEKVNQVVASIPPGSSALLTVVESDQAPDFEALLHSYSANTFALDISADLADALNERADEVHDALMDQLT